METPAINYLAVLVAALVYMVLGALWYSPLLFGNAWMKGIAKTKEQLAAAASPLNYLWTLIISFITAYGIARVMLWSGGKSIYDAIIISLVAGVCFVLSTISMHNMYEDRPGSLTVINGLYHLVGFILIGIIIGAWR